MLKGRVGGENRVVGLNDRRAELRRGVHAELELRLLAVVGRKTLEEESAETRTGATTERVEDEEALKTGTVVGETAELVHDRVDLLFADGVVSASVCYADTDQDGPLSQTNKKSYSYWQHPPCP